jgi:nicotinamidase-related amidase
MPADVRELLDARSTAVLTVECQRGVIGDRGPLPALTEAVKASGFVPRAASVLAAARKAGAPVLHGVVHRRPDGGGMYFNCRLFSAVKDSGAAALLPGTEAAEVIPEFGPAKADWVVPRYHGVSLFHDTELDSLLRTLGVTTVVPLGVSLNIAVTGTTIEAVNRGYQVVLPADGVVGTPPEYAEQMLRHTLRMLATVTTCEAIAAAFAAQGGGSS